MERFGDRDKLMQADGADVPERTVDVRKLNAPQMRGALFEVPYTLEGEAEKNG